MTRTVIVGVGNPLLTDDGAGIHVARAIKERIPTRADLFVTEACVGGIRLMDHLVGFDRAIIIDALWTGHQPPGTIVHLSLSELQQTRNTQSTHDMDLGMALEVGRAAGLHLPDEVDVWGIEVEDARGFSEELTDTVRAAVPLVVEQVLGMERCFHAEVLS